jgi:hypothetical protein
MLILHLLPLIILTLSYGKPSGRFTRFPGIKFCSGGLFNKLSQSSKPSVIGEFKVKPFALGVFRKKRQLSMFLKIVNMQTESGSVLS